MESETSTVIGVNESVVDVVGSNEAGLCEPIITDNHADSASGEPTAVVVSPPEENSTSSEATTKYYTLVVRGSSYDGNSVELTSESSETITLPILSSTVIEIEDYDEVDTTHQLLFMPTEDGALDEGSIWTQSPLIATASGESDNNLSDSVDITKQAFISSNIGLEDMGTDIVTIISPGSRNMVKVKMCVNKHTYRGNDEDDEVNIEVVDDIISERPDSTMTIDSETTSTSFSSDGFDDGKTDSLNLTDSENDKELCLEIRNDSKHSKRTPNRKAICGVPDDCPLIRIPPPVTRTPLPNLPGIRGTSLAATQPVVLSKAIDSTPLNADKEKTKQDNIQNGPILHSVSSILLKENDSCSSETELVRPVPQLRPCFGAFAGLNHQLLSGFSFAHTSPSLSLPPLTVFSSPLRVLHPSFSSPQSGITPIPPFPNTPFPSTVGLRGTLPGNLPSLRIIQPTFATSADTRRIVRRRRHSGNSKSSEEDPESQKVRRRQANARERDRVTQLNTGFEQLRRVLPWVQQGRRTSKVDTLRAAISYIDHLRRVLWDADHAGYLGGAVAVGPGLPTDICKFVDFRPTFGMIPHPPPPVMCIGAAERGELERSSIGNAVPDGSLIKASTQAMIAGTGHPSPALHWLAEFQETLRRLPKPSPQRFLSDVDNRPRIVVVDSDSNNNAV